MSSTTFEFIDLFGNICWILSNSIINRSDHLRKFDHLKEKRACEKIRLLVFLTPNNRCVQSRNADIQILQVQYDIPILCEARNKWRWRISSNQLLGIQNENFKQTSERAFSTWTICPSSEALSPISSSKRNVCLKSSIRTKSLSSRTRL